MIVASRGVRSATGLALLLALGAGGCRRKDSDQSDDGPIRSLAARTPSTRFVHEFWLKEAEQKSALWDSAYAICSAYWLRNDGSRPNCGHVYTARFYQAGATTPVRARNMTVDSLRP